MNSPGTLWLSIVLCVFFVFVQLAADAKKWVVSVKNYSFAPSNLTHVRAGDTIQWVWQSGIHTTTSTSLPPGADSWDYPINQDTTSFIYIPTENGIFYYHSTPDTARPMNGHFLVTGASGFDGIADKNGFSISPDPFHDLVCIHFPGNRTSFAQVQIFSLEGKILRSANISASAGSMSQMLDVTDLPRGAVIFRFTDGSRTVSVFKAIHD
jgi:plastocyanin